MAGSQKIRRDTSLQSMTLNQGDSLPKQVVKNTNFMASKEKIHKFMENRVANDSRYWVGLH